MKLKNYIPALEWMPKYKKSWLRSDLIAGLTVAIMLVPQGMAYAFLAGMPPIYGLYGGLIPLFLYALLGTSRQLSIGPVAVSALLVLAGVSQLAVPESEEYIQLVLLAGLMIGCLQLLFSFLRLGFLVNFLSHPVLTGFTSAAAIIIAISQLKDLLGFSIPRFSHISETLYYAVEHFSETNWIAVGLCIGSIAFIFIGRKISKRIPGALLVVVIGTILAWVFKLEQYGLDIVKGVPEGLPIIGAPTLSIANAKALIPTVLTVTIIGIVESISIAKVLESKHQDYSIQPNQELLALGISKIGGAFFQALPTSGSFTRSAVNSDSGAKSGMASIFTSLIVVFTLLFLTPLFYYLPKAVLAAIILLALKSLFNLKEAIHLWKVHKQDFLMMLSTFVITLIFGIEEGVLAGVVLSVLAVLYRSSIPHVAILGKLPDSSDYRNVERFEEAIEHEEITILRFDSQLYFANADHFKDSVKSIVNARNSQLLILDATGINEMDSSGLHVLEEINTFLQAKNIRFNICGVIGPVRDLLFKSGIIKSMGQHSFFLNIEDAVEYHEATPRERVQGWDENAVQTNILPD